MNIGDQIHSRRREKKMTIVELSKKTGVSRNTISEIENSKARPTICTLAAIGNALECELDVTLMPWESFVDGVALCTRCGK